MAKFEIIMPKMGESIIEATITKWLKAKGDTVGEDEAIAEIATDKVDSEIPSPVEGIVSDILFHEGDVVPVGKVIAIIQLGNEPDEQGPGMDKSEAKAFTDKSQAKSAAAAITFSGVDKLSKGSRFYSPLVKSIANQENVAAEELDMISGSGKDGRVTKRDILEYLKKRAQSPVVQPSGSPSRPGPVYEAPKVPVESGDEIFEMDRMRKLIADHMIMSKHVSAHVTSFIDVDVTNIVTWREKMKDAFLMRENEKLTYTPVFIEASARVLKEFPRVNASVDGYTIIHRKKINIGMATALPSGNLIVPVIRNADQKSLLGIVRDVNDLATRARSNNLLPDEIQGGTFTVTNFGTFDSLTGTPVINQPQVAILGIGAIRKIPVVIETAQGDVIGIRNIMILSLAYDHRIVDGALGGMFLKRMKEVLENWDTGRTL